ncbi:MAG: hypothetical protein GY704_17000, partial [Phycisphaeraceae bacterium]|nr:hypothetical protein [Phycisphaeraceae bacterium]
MVVDDLWADLEGHTRDYEREAPKTWQEANERALADFVVERTRHFVERPEATDPAIAFAMEGRGPRSDRRSDAPWALCLTGEPGSGKSALYARIHQTLTERESRGDLTLLSHAAGINAGSISVGLMLQVWIGKLARVLDVANPLEAADGGEPPHPEPTAPERAEAD